MTGTSGLEKTSLGRLSENMGWGGRWPSRVFSSIRHFCRRLARIRSHAISLRQLRRLSDRELRDMGIERHQIGAAVDTLLTRSDAGTWRRYHPWHRGKDR
ncbi:MAG TPA: DUF1127 domain-containing protein [Dongiaceae bacterium]|nr:DUF1127 domain-containing protein [Dongiaceae bacterium]